MPLADKYRKQATLLIRALPLVAEEDDYALEGGTAINLFIRDMPRLSVDIDLTYLPVQSYPQSLAAIDAALKRIAGRVKASIPGAQITESKLDGRITKLFVRSDGVQIKMDVTPVIRGCVYGPDVRQVSDTVEETFGFAEIKVVSFADLYGGKIVAALDRQHPRDLFDIRDLLANEGIDDALRRAFIVYLLSHNRPMSEVLKPTRLDIEPEFKRGFEGMTNAPVTIEELTAARESLIGSIVGKMPPHHRKFLISFERGVPDWSLLEVESAKDLPAVKRRQENLDKATPEKRAALVARLEEVLRD